MKRKRKIGRRASAITPAAVEAFIAGDVAALCREVGMGKPWHSYHPLDPDLDFPCVYPPGSGGAASYELARELRDQLRAAAAEST